MSIGLKSTLIGGCEMPPLGMSWLTISK